MQERHETCKGPRAVGTDGETERTGTFDTRTKKTGQADLDKTQTLEKRSRRVNTETNRARWQSTSRSETMFAGVMGHCWNGKKSLQSEY